MTILFIMLGTFLLSVCLMATWKLFGKKEQLLLEHRKLLEHKPEPEYKKKFYKRFKRSKQC